MEVRDIDMEDTIKVKDVYSRLWNCRDFEIDHVWQRAVFLSAFLLACFAGYGGLIVSLSTSEQVRVSFSLANAAAFGICILGIILSLIWIMMAKGSKAWYEHYEAALCVFETNHITRNGSDCGVLEAHKMKDFKVPITSSWLWNTKGGAYSVARINIVLGHLSSVVWLSLSGFHLYFARMRCDSIRDAEKSIEWLLDPSIMLVLLLVILSCFWLYSKVSIRSSFLKDDK